MAGPANPQVTDEAIDAGAQALRERDMAGRITVPWDKIPNGQKKKWRERSLACLTAALADHVVVPIEPTDEMIFAMHHQIDWCRDDQNTYALEHTSQTDNGIGTTCKQDILDAYRAMISAAPLPQKEG